MKARVARLGSAEPNEKVSVRFRALVSRCGRACLIVGAALIAACAAPATREAQPPAPLGAYSRVERELLVALNQARTSPAATVGWLDELAGYYNGALLKKPSWPTAIRTNEGVAAVREAIGALRAQPPVPALTLNDALTRAARDHATDQARTGATGHSGSDGSTVATRVARYGTWLVSLSENISYGHPVTGRDVIESLIVDDGVRDRGHRRNIFDPTARAVGIACGAHRVYGTVCVIDQTGGMR